MRTRLPTHTGLITVLCLVLLGCVLAVAGEADGETPTVVFIGTNEYPAINVESAEAFGVQLQQYNLDAHRNLEKKLSEGLPTDLVEAERIANERLMALPGLEVQAAFQGIALATQWDIRKAPAYVFDDGRAVIYGVTDLAVALKRWQYHRMRR